MKKRSSRKQPGRRDSAILKRLLDPTVVVNMAITREQFQRRLTDSGLLEPSAVESAVKRVPEDQAADGKALAQALVRNGVLTKYQAAAVYQGKTKGLVLGNYVIQSRIGTGGMGQVFKAVHKRMEREVALKVLPSDKMDSDDAVRRFHREVKAAAILNHPNIVTAHDADEADCLHFMVMEYVDGSDMATLIKESGAFPIDLAVECIRQAALALEYAHKQGVIHRDIKPANLLLERESTSGKSPLLDPQGAVVKILDMGLARLSRDIDQNTQSRQLTQTGQVMGTVDFMAPEQAESTRVTDHRADIYSLGCTFYALLTADAPYEGDSLIEKLMAHRVQPAPNLLEARQDIPPRLNEIFQKMVAKEPEDRYQTMDELATELADLQKQGLPGGGGGVDLGQTAFFEVDSSKLNLSSADAQHQQQTQTEVGGKTITPTPIQRHLETSPQHGRAVSADTLVEAAALPPAAGAEPSPLLTARAEESKKQGGAGRLVLVVVILLLLASGAGATWYYGFGPGSAAVADSGDPQQPDGDPGDNTPDANDPDNGGTPKNGDDPPDDGGPGDVDPPDNGGDSDNNPDNPPDNGNPDDNQVARVDPNDPMNQGGETTDPMVPDDSSASRPWRADVPSPPIPPDLPYDPPMIVDITPIPPDVPDPRDDPVRPPIPPDPMARGLAGHWSFTDGGGDIARDQSAEENHGHTFLVLPEDWESIQVGEDTKLPALSLNGRAYVGVRDNDALDGRNALSIALWVQSTGKRDREEMILIDKGPETGYALSLDSTGSPRFRMALVNGRRTTAETFNAPNKKMTDGEPHHIALVYDGEKIQFFFDGKPSYNLRMYGKIRPSREPLLIGSGPRGRNGFYGHIADVRIYDRPLSPEEIVELATP